VAVFISFVQPCESFLGPVAQRSGHSIPCRSFVGQQRRRIPDPTAVCSLNAEPSEIASQALQQLPTSLNAITYYKDAENPAVYLAALFVVAASVFTIVGSEATKEKKREMYPIPDEERPAYDFLNDIYDPLPEDRQLTEAGTKGCQKRIREASTYRSQYLATVQDEKNARNKSVRYADMNISFLAKMLRSVDIKQGSSFLDLGSGFGRTAVYAALLGKFGRVTGIEFLGDLAARGAGYAEEVKNLWTGKKTPITFYEGDFTDPQYSSEIKRADVIFSFARFLTSRQGIATELSELLEKNAKRGAKILTFQQRLDERKGFRLLQRVSDPAGDLQVNVGYIYVKE